MPNDFEKLRREHIKSKKKAEKEEIKKIILSEPEFTDKESKEIEKFVELRDNEKETVGKRGNLGFMLILVVFFVSPVFLFLMSVTDKNALLLQLSNKTSILRTLETDNVRLKAEAENKYSLKKIEDTVRGDFAYQSISPDKKVRVTMKPYQEVIVFKNPKDNVNELFELLKSLFTF